MQSFVFSYRLRLVNAFISPSFGHRQGSHLRHNGSYKMLHFSLCFSVCLFIFGGYVIICCWRYDFLFEFLTAISGLLLFIFLSDCIANSQNIVAYLVSIIVLSLVIFLHSRWPVGFHWSLSDSKSQISQTVLSILAERTSLKGQDFSSSFQIFQYPFKSFGNRFKSTNNTFSNRWSFIGVYTMSGLVSSSWFFKIFKLIIALLWSGWFQIYPESSVLSLFSRFSETVPRVQSTNSITVLLLLRSFCSSLIK